ncbi:MAG: AAA family ATPase [Planctomycetaceae bacterium]|nr:AAA family ATPase [Planctomycetaceae bacterium]
MPVDPKSIIMREVEIPETIREFYTTDFYKNRIHGLSRLNVFIGPNDSGKSRLLREIFASNCLAYGATDESSEIVRTHVAKLRKAMQSLSGSIQPEGVKAIDQLIRETNPRLRGGPQERGNAGERAHALRRVLDSHLVGSQLRDALESDPPTFFGVLSRHLEALNTNPPPSEMNFLAYAPSLRGLRGFGEGKNPYLRTQGDYFGGRNVRDEVRNQPEMSGVDGTFIHTGLNLFEEVRSNLLGSLAQRRLITRFEKYLSITYFDGKDVTLIPRHRGDVLYVKIGDAEELPVYSLGDGISQVIILTLPLVVHQDKRLLYFIEEPELYLHPGYQRKLIDAILTLPGTRRVFVATHSHQFLDITIDRDHCTVYKLKKKLSGGTDDEMKAKFKISLVSDDDHPLLAELGVRNSSVFLSNCTIWVEGVTDRLYVRRFLDLYQKANGDRELIEDLHYSFVEYGGGNIVHWSFWDENTGIRVDRLCGHLLLIEDSDFSDDIGRQETKNARFAQLTKTLGDRYLRLPVSEIENLLTPATIKAVVRGYERNANATLNEFEQDDYREAKLGKFIEEKVLPDVANCKRKSGRYADPSGTVMDKPAFCRHAFTCLNSIDDLSPDALAVAKRVYAFIAESNPR